MLSTTILILALLQAGPDTRPTIIAKASNSPGRTISIIYYDDRFLFAERGYGSASDVGGNTVPGLFVHSKERNCWIQITAISTMGGRFGSSASSNPEEAKILALAQVAWNFRSAATRPYIDQPLRTSGSISFPEQITYDPATERYELRYMASWHVRSAETVLYINRADLTAAFDGIRRQQ